MRVTLRELRSYLLTEINASLTSRAMASVTPVMGPSYEGQRFLAALDPTSLAKGEIKVLGTVMFFQQHKEVPLEDGTSVRPYIVDSMFATTPVVAIALMKLLLGTCQNVMPSRSVSPAAARFISSYYTRNRANPDLVMPVRGKSDVEDPSMHCVYRDDGEVDTKSEVKRGYVELKHAAKKLGVSVKELRDKVHDEQFGDFRQAYQSLKSDRPIVKLALSGGEPTLEKIEAAARTDNYEAMTDFLRRVPDPIPTDILEWVKEHLDIFHEDELPADVRVRYEKA